MEPIICYYLLNFSNCSKLNISKFSLVLVRNKVLAEATQVFFTCMCYKNLTIRKKSPVISNIASYEQSKNKRTIDNISTKRRLSKTNILRYSCTSNFSTISQLAMLLLISSMCTTCSFGELKFVEDTLKIFAIKKFSKGVPLNFFTKKVARGNAVQIFSNFPAKRLSVCVARKIVTPFNKLNDFYLTN